MYTNVDIGKKRMTLNEKKNIYICIKNTLTEITRDIHIDKEEKTRAQKSNHWTRWRK